MWLIMALAVVVIVSIIGHKKVDYLSSWEPLFLFLGIVGGVFLLITVASIPLYRATTFDHLAQRDALQQTYNQLRTSQSPLEMATVGGKIADWNAWLASSQYWNSQPQWSIWWPDEVKHTQPIK